MQEVFGEKDEQGNFTGRYSTGGQIFNNLSEARRAAAQYVPGDPVAAAPVLTLGGAVQTLVIVLAIFGVLVFFFNHPLDTGQQAEQKATEPQSAPVTARNDRSQTLPNLPPGCYWIDASQFHCPPGKGGR